MAPPPPERGAHAAVSRPEPAIHVFIGTKAQYIKTAPLLRLMDERGVAYRLIDSGQHAALSASMRTDLHVRDPDVYLGGDRDVESIPQALAWAGRLAADLVDRERVLDDVFGGRTGVCVVHGDTPSTLLSMLLAKRAGLRVAHLEAGLRSHRLLHPFPEELIRLAVMHVADVLFAPDEEALVNLARLRPSGRVVALEANTSAEALRWALSDVDRPPGQGPAIVTCHRVENLHRATRVRRLVDVVCERVRREPVRFVGHGPTRQTLARLGLDRRMAHAGVQLVGLAPHDTFARWLHDAPWVITDGGSIQEECGLLGTPTLLWRGHTERPDGIDRNVVLSGYDPRTVARFLADPAAYRRPATFGDVHPSREILDVLQAMLADWSADWSAGWPSERAARGSSRTLRAGS